MCISQAEAQESVLPAINAHTDKFDKETKAENLATLATDMTGHGASWRMSARAHAAVKTALNALEFTAVASFRRVVFAQQESFNSNSILADDQLSHMHNQLDAAELLGGALEIALRMNDPAMTAAADLTLAVATMRQARVVQQKYVTVFQIPPYWTELHVFQHFSPFGTCCFEYFFTIYVFRKTRVVPTSRD